jgi:hypothetical protein
MADVGHALSFFQPGLTFLKVSRQLFECLLHVLIRHRHFENLRLFPTERRITYPVGFSPSRSGILSEMKVAMAASAE